MRRGYVGVAVFLLGCGAGKGNVPLSSAEAPADAAVALDDALAPPPAANAVAQYVGEVHLHQFPMASHAWAAFIDAPRPLAAVQGDSVTEIDTAITSIEGPCTLYVIPSCAPGCTGASFCQATNQCMPLPTWKYVDGGAIRVAGSSLVPLIRLWFDGSVGSYQADPPPGSPALFGGGERLSIVGGAGDTSFKGELPAPLPVQMTSPDSTQPLRLPLSGPLDVTWVSQHSDEMEVLVSASSNDGHTTEIRCVTSDTGALTIPASFIAELPPPPRITRIEVLRVEQRILPVGTSSSGVLVHAAFSNWHNGTD